MEKTDSFVCKQFTIHHCPETLKTTTEAFLLGTLCPLLPSHLKILDIGTGTGILSLILAQRLSDMAFEFTIDAIDCEYQSATCAQDNVFKSKWSKKINAYHSSLQEWENGPYDLIICNPPYHSRSLKSPNESRNIIRHAENLRFDILLFHVNRVMSESGSATFILPEAEAQKFDFFAQKVGLIKCGNIEIKQTQQSKTWRRVITYSKRYNVENSHTQQWIVYESDYKSLSQETKVIFAPFYLNL